ncbi:DUF6584 family protein [Saccharothrix algeriensis]|uniref:Uncharacterized protein n=1 Tax=Saccharothrix algeriensis TaxID=173560 RepID=A0A8T8HTW7_9PSEU|nr:DUF6584 family protein [Saccharothrix algeriensis]MBM7813265.1 hypothetical protein [Saccharothrix algeriensis]QTR01821.1 hypothetical protein J7S33_21390 [Saccharothrix algeriensis]
MPVELTLRKAAEEVERGDLASVLRARQRLVGLVTSFPDRLDLRERLAEVYRALGDTAQAGRWAYLSDERDEREVAAFERAYRTPEARLAALNWVGGEATAETARTRLLALRGAVAERVRADLAAADDRDSSWVVNALVLLGVVLVLLCFVVGAVTLVLWVVRWFAG